MYRSKVDSDLVSSCSRWDVFALVVLALGTAAGCGSSTPAAQHSWGTPQLIETEDAGDASSVQLAINSSGNAVSVWQQSDGIHNNIWANYYTAGSGWGTAQLIETDDNDAEEPQVAMDSAGNAIAVWDQSSSEYSNIWANRYQAGVGWGTAQLIETDDAGDAASAQVAMDDSGRAVAVWRQSDGSTQTIRVNRYVSGTWDTAQPISSGGALYPDVAVDNAGNAVVVWQQSDGVRNNIWANSYSTGSGWGIAGLVETDDAGEARWARVAIDGSGNAVAVWNQFDGTRNSAWANTYLAGTGWGTAQLIETNNTGDAGDPQVAMDGAGNAVAIWSQSDGLFNHVWANHYAAGSTWGTEQLLEDLDTDEATNPRIAMDGSGGALAVWQQHSSTGYHVWVNRYVTGSGWGTAQLLETSDTYSANNPKVAMNASGDAVAAWEQSGDAYLSIWANRY